MNKTYAIRTYAKTYMQPWTKHMQSGPCKSTHATVNKNTCNQDLCKNMNIHEWDYGRQAVFCKLAVLKTVKKRVQYLSSACTKHLRMDLHNTVAVYAMPWSQMPLVHHVNKSVFSWYLPKTLRGLWVFSLFLYLFLFFFRLVRCAFLMLDCFMHLIGLFASDLICFRGADLSPA
jgi:hypothetical protein